MDGFAAGERLAAKLTFRLGLNLEQVTFKGAAAMGNLTRDFFISLSNNKILNANAKKWGFRLGAEKFVAGIDIDSVVETVKEINAHEEAKINIKDKKKNENIQNNNLEIYYNKNNIVQNGPFIVEKVNINQKPDNNDNNNKIKNEIKTQKSISNINK